ncbi:unnamed protein product [Victoria cruziana]
MHRGIPALETFPESKNEPPPPLARLVPASPHSSSIPCLLHTILGCRRVQGSHLLLLEPCFTSPRRAIAYLVCWWHGKGAGVALEEFTTSNRRVCLSEGVCMMIKLRDVLAPFFTHMAKKTV